jgi:hypothetical protein
VELLAATKFGANAACHPWNIWANSLPKAIPTFEIEPPRFAEGCLPGTRFVYPPLIKTASASSRGI